MAIFECGIASGDPLTDRVVIWTRVESDQPSAEVAWVVALDQAMTNVVATGTAMAQPQHDHTVHVDVAGLEQDTYYWYKFRAMGEDSPIGRTRTLPADPSSVRFAYTSCAKHNAGFFNVYARIADRDDISFLLHLGDYIYETSETPPASQTPSRNIGRPFDPPHECLTLADYRVRYRQYRRDPDVQALHLRHPIIQTTDDHEVADGAWRDGAQEHKAEYGPWAQRKIEAFQARYEWLPIRNPDPDDPLRVWRSIPFGSLADIILIETRLHRDEPVAGDAMKDPSRSVLGPDQRAWLWETIQSSTARWRVLGNPSVMAQTWLPDLPEDIKMPLEKVKLIDRGVDGPDYDQWDGYPAERKQLLDLIESRGRGTSIVLSADVHVGLAIELNQDAYERDEPVCVELVSPSITSQNLDDKMKWGYRVESLPLEARILESLPHWRWVDLDSHGYVVVDLDADRVHAEFWGVPTVLKRVNGETLLASFETRHGDPHLTKL